jgi:imidazolonepropionase-like amidohydrolase
VGASVVGTGGRAILPGFINAHVHGSQSEETLKEWGRDGVTTVREMSGNVEELASRWELRRDKAAARLVMVGGPITTEGGYGSVDGIVDSPESARRKVVELIAAGADLIKVAIEDQLQGRRWKMLSIEEMTAIAGAAHEREARVTAHVSRARHVSLAVQAGVDDLGHMAVDHVPDAVIASVIQQDIYWVPTLELWRGVSRMHSLDWDVKAVQNLRRFAAAGGKVALGTDYDGYACEFDLGMPMTEIALMREAQITPMQIIVAATKNAAHVCNVEDEVGTVEPGKIADVVVVQGDPLEDVRTMTDIWMVVHNGVVIRGPHTDGESRRDVSGSR